MFVIRARFAKYNECAYISHLDLQRVMSRALRQSGVPVWYSNGFNPHIYMTFALPLSLTHETACDAVDFKSEETPKSEWINLINDCLPNGIKVYSVYIAASKPAGIGFASYELHTRGDTSAFNNAIDCYNNADKVEVIKKTKRSEKLVDLKEYIPELVFSDENNAVNVKLPAGELTIGPSLLVDYLEGLDAMHKGDIAVLRVSILDKQEKEWI